MPIGGTPRDPALKGHIGSLRMLRGYLVPYKREIIISLIALFITSGGVLGLGVALRYLIDQGIAKANPELLDRTLFVFLGVVLMLALASFFRVYYSIKVSEWVVGQIRKDVFAHVVRLDMGFFESRRTGELLSRFTADAASLQAVLSSQLPMALRQFVTSLGGLILLMQASWTLTKYTGLLIPLVLATVLVLGRYVRQYSRVSQERLASAASHAEETISGIRAIHALSLEGEAVARFNSEIAQVLAVAKKRFLSKAVMSSIVIGLILSGLVIVLWMGGKYVLSGHMTPGELSAFIFYGVVTAGGLSGLSDSFGEIQQAAGSTERLMELMSFVPNIQPPLHPAQLDESVQGRISFYNVTFSYPSRPDRPSVQDVSLTVMPGETVALVGPSGAGKTTLFSLLLRFYDPSSGKVTIDGLDIRELEPQAFRRHIGLVPQDPVIFSGNAWENIRCGNPAASFKDLMMAAENAAALEFLEKLPDGLDTYLGEKGVRLSGGQKQRIAIARAMVRNPRILLLDEATSALDSENERKVQEAMDRLMQGRTTLVIAHRLSTVKNASRIVVMNEGKIEAIGKHEELMMNSPLYQKLAGQQFGLLS